MITLKDINKYYTVGSGILHALKDVNMAIEAGDFIAIRGKSGSGKTTLLNILGCLDFFDSGTYTFDGTVVNGAKDSKLATLRNQKIGFVLQDFSLLNHKSVLFNVMLPHYFGKTPLKKAKALALDAIESVGLLREAGKNANQLSGGQRQRVAIARAIVNNPAIVLADEPTGALDSETSRQIMELLKGMNEKGITIVVVTHEDAVASYCKKHVHIEDGVVSQLSIYK